MERGCREMWTFLKYEDGVFIFHKEGDEPSIVRAFSKEDAVKAGFDVNVLDSLIQLPVEPDQGASLSTIEAEQDVLIVEKENVTEKEDKGLEIWNGKKDRKQRSLDEQATETFCSLVKKHYKELNDQQTYKKEVWAKIGSEMEKAGYCMGKDAGLKSNNKWDNMMKSYRKYVRDSSQTGSGADVLDDVPPYLEKIMEIIGEGHSVHPVYIGDSMAKVQKPEKFQKANFVRKVENIKKKITPGQKCTSPLGTPIDGKAIDQSVSASSSTSAVSAKEGHSCPSPQNIIPREKRATQSVSPCEGPSNSLDDCDFSDDLDTDPESVQPKRRRIRPTKASHFEKLIGMLAKSEEVRQQELEERKKREKESEAKKEAEKERRHKEKLSLYREMQKAQIAAMREIFGKQDSRKKRQDSANDSDS